MNLSCEIEHLRTFHKLDEGFQFVLHLEGVQSARLLCYAIWRAGVQFQREYQLKIMRDSRTTATESGMAEVDGVKVCNFMTTWGDGIFEVHRDLSDSGELVQIRIEFDFA